MWWWSLLRPELGVVFSGCSSPLSLVCSLAHPSVLGPKDVGQLTFRRAPPTLTVRPVALAVDMAKRTPTIDVDALPMAAGRKPFDFHVYFKADSQAEFAADLRTRLLARFDCVGDDG